jgi:DNA modification methylase
MVAVLHECHRVLRDDGTLWLNVGDSYGDGKQLLGIPWRLALAAQADGWVLRQDIIWHKPSPMPESVTDRCTKAHEYVFLFTKRPVYFFDAEAIKEPSEIGSRNRRSVWRIATKPYAGAHFATMPPELAETCIKAGTSQRGACPLCGSPWERITKRTKLTRPRPSDYVKRTGEAGTGNSCANSVAGVAVETLGWQQSCKCEPHEPVPCVVLDPFAGSGTTLAVAKVLGRDSVGIELNPDYIALAEERIAQAGVARKKPRVAVGQGSLFA